MPIRAKIIIGCLGFVVVMVALGLFMRAQEYRLGQLSMDVYDNALIGVSYARKAQTGFVRLASDLRTDPKSIGGAGVRSRVDELLGDLDVAIERAISDKGREEATRIRAAIAALRDDRAEGPTAAVLAEIDGALDKLVQKYTADGFIYRVRTERLVDATDEGVVIALAAAVVLAAVITICSARRSCHHSIAP